MKHLLYKSDEGRSTTTHEEILYKLGHDYIGEKRTDIILALSPKVRWCTPSIETIADETKISTTLLIKFNSKAILLHKL